MTIRILTTILDWTFYLKLISIRLRLIKKPSIVNMHSKSKLNTKRIIFTLFYVLQNAGHLPSSGTMKGNIIETAKTNERGGERKREGVWVLVYV